MHFVVCRYFSKLKFQKILSSILSVSNSLGPDPVGRFVGPDLGPNCLQRSSADGKIHRWLEKS